jgi:hypothetical protein
VSDNATWQNVVSVYAGLNSTPDDKTSRLLCLITAEAVAAHLGLAVVFLM